MPRGSIELTNSRKDEIINACASLYETMSFKESLQLAKEQQFIIIFRQKRKFFLLCFNENMNFGLMN